MYYYQEGAADALGAINWDKVKDAVKGILDNALDGAKRKAAEELIRRVEGTPEYREIERAVQVERARQAFGGLGAYLPYILLGGAAYFLLRRR